MPHFEEEVKMMKKQVITPYFIKYITEYLPFLGAFHHFTGCNPNENPHCHNFDFESFVIEGSYMEEVFEILESGTWWRTVYHRKQGTSHKVKAEHIHRIIELPEGNCITYVKTSEPRRKWCEWQFNDSGIFVRQEDEHEFKPYRKDE